MAKKPWELLWDENRDFEVQCRHCGKKVSPSHRECPYCGTGIEGIPGRLAEITDYPPSAMGGPVSKRKIHYGVQVYENGAYQGEKSANTLKQARKVKAKWIKEGRL